MSSELILTVATATPTGSIALTRGEELLAEQILKPAGSHSDFLIPAIDDMLNRTGVVIEEIDAFASVVGPGAFTGLRVGVSTVKGLAQATGKPVICVSSLQALALQAPAADLPVCVMLDARKGEVYSGLFQFRNGIPESMSPEQVASPESVLESIDGNTVFIGDGCRAYRTLIVRHCAERARFVSWVFNPLRASSAAVLAHELYRNGEVVSPLELTPVYIRLSEAELNQVKGTEKSV
jgi:tRNA threonylcarbamoyladenosine biosynthesis protein TsaB